MGAIKIVLRIAPRSNMCELTVQLDQDFLPGNLRFARQFRCLTRRFKISNDNFTMKSVKYLVFLGNSSASTTKIPGILW